MKNRPPKLARWLFQKLSGTAHVDDLVGDMDEWFYLNLQSMSSSKAKMKYWQQVFSLAFSYAVQKRKKDSQYAVHYYANAITFSMLRNYLTIAIRNIYQYKYFSLINVFGLAIGMSISLLVIALYSFVSTYDDFHANRDRIYSITTTQVEGVEEGRYATAPFILADRMSHEYGGVSAIVKILRETGMEIRTTREDIPVRTYYTDPGFFSMFTFPMVSGSSSALAEPNQVILTESFAKKIFGTDDAAGKTITLATGKILQVGGVMKDLPSNTHFSFEMLVALSTIPPSEQRVTDQWQEFTGQYVYVLAEQPEELRHYLNQVSMATYSQASKKVSFHVSHLNDLVTSDQRRGIGVQWEMSGFIFFSIFAAMILLPACFNYTNISIARALRRAKEIGLRKTMGGVRNQIFFQFLTETIVITLMALIGSLLIFVLIKREFQSMLVSGSTLDLSLSLALVLKFVGFAVITGTIAGIFPAFYFASLNPIQALKSKINTRGTSMRIRKTLTVVQFTLSFGFILALVVFSRQYRYSVNFDFGFTKENTVNVQLQEVDYEKVRTAFEGVSAVQSISMSSGLPGLGASQVWLKGEGTDSVAADQFFADAHFMNGFGLELLAGKNFPDDVTGADRYLIVNENFVRAQKINAAEAIGRIYEVEGKSLQVIGVVKNFHYAPLTEPIGRFMLRNDPSKFVYANLHVIPTDPFDLFSQLEGRWKSLGTEKKFVGNFFDDELAQAYDTYTVLLKVVGFLGLLAVTISMLGMLGMVVFTAESKTKEVGIRKVMGATVSSIAILLSRDYLKLMLIAMIISIPLTAFILDVILAQIQYYRVNLSVWDVLISALVLVGIGLLTIASQTVRTARLNPVTTLRNE